MENNYIIPIIISLFHLESVSDIILNKSSTNNLIIYLQEFIKYRITNKNCTITKNDLNICKQLCVKLGMGDNNIPNIYSSLFNIFNMDEIEIENNKIKIKIKIKMITVIPKHHKYNTSIKKMLLDWQNNENIVVTNTPQFICLNIVRTSQICIDIQKKIKLNTNNNWGFYSVLCMRDNYYYVLTLKDTVWFIYNKDNNNAFYEVKMDDKQIVDRVKQDCIFVIYKLM